MPNDFGTKRPLTETEMMPFHGYRPRKGLYLPLFIQEVSGYRLAGRHSRLARHLPGCCLGRSPGSRIPEESEVCDPLPTPQTLLHQQTEWQESTSSAWPEPASCCATPWSAGPETTLSIPWGHWASSLSMSVGSPTGGVRSSRRRLEATRNRRIIPRFRRHLALCLRRGRLAADGLFYLRWHGVRHPCPARRC